MSDIRTFFKEEVGKLATRLDAIPDLTKLNDCVVQLKQEVESLTSERDKLKTSLEQSDAQVEQHAQTIEILTTERDALQSKIDDPKGSIQQAASAKAIKIVGSQGVPPITEPNADGQNTGGEDPSTPDEKAAHYASIKDPIKKRLYWQQNRNEIVLAR